MKHGDFFSGYFLETFADNNGKGSQEFTIKNERGRQREFSNVTFFSVDTSARVLGKHISLSSLGFPLSLSKEHISRGEADESGPPSLLHSYIIPSPLS